MNWGSWLLWGFVSTVVLTTLMAGSQGLGQSRMNLPYLLGTMFTPNRDRAKVVGILVHFINGWLFSLLYVDRLILFGEGSLRNALREYLVHYHTERNHQGLENRLIIPFERPPDTDAPVVTTERLGGLLRSYRRAA